MVFRVSQAVAQAGMARRLALSDVGEEAFAKAQANQVHAVHAQARAHHTRAQARTRVLTLTYTAPRLTHSLAPSRPLSPPTFWPGLRSAS